jgi:hypothetical protein
MGEVQLMLTDPERELLVRLLETTLRDVRIEEHRTRTISYREHILREEDVLVGLLSKLGKPSA